MSSTPKKYRLITIITVNNIVLLRLFRLAMAAPVFSEQPNCGQGNNCSDGEFCQEDFSVSYCVPCVDCSVFNRKAGTECDRLKADCGECFPDFHEIESTCIPVDNSTKWSFENIVDQIPLLPDLPYSDVILLISAAVLIAGGLIAILVLERKIVSKATANQLQHEILLLAVRRHLDALRERGIGQGDTTNRPTVTENEPLDYNTITTMQFRADDDELLAALDNEIQQEHQPRDILARNHEAREGPDNFNEASALLDHTDDDRYSIEEPEQVVPQGENQNDSCPSRFQADIYRQQELELENEEFYHSRPQEEQQRLTD